MKIEELVPLTNGLSVSAGHQTLVCDRARIGPVTDDTVDMSFWLVGTDLVPRLTLPRQRVALGTPRRDCQPGAPGRARGHHGRPAPAALTGGRSST